MFFMFYQTHCMTFIWIISCIYIYINIPHNKRKQATKTHVKQVIWLNWSRFGSLTNLLQGQQGRGPFFPAFLRSATSLLWHWSWKWSGKSCYLKACLIASIKGGYIFWLVVSTPLKNRNVNWDDEISPIYIYIYKIYMYMYIYIYGGCPKYCFPDGPQSLSQSRSNRGTIVSNRGRVSFFVDLIIYLKYKSCF